jgi:hypothetical protein
MKTTTLTMEVGYDPDITNPGDLAEAADNLLETSLNTEGVLDECGDPQFGAFLVQDDDDPEFREDTKIKDAVFAFDELTSASYYGFGFKQVLIEDAEARKAALVLLNRLRHHGAKGLTK